jgi:hypothetical protein
MEGNGQMDIQVDKLTMMNANVDSGQSCHETGEKINTYHTIS